MVRNIEGTAVHMDLKVKRVHVDLVLTFGTNKESVFNGDVDGAIAYMAKRMCELCKFPRVSVDVEF